MYRDLFSKMSVRVLLPGLCRGSILTWIEVGHPHSDNRVGHIEKAGTYQWTCASKRREISVCVGMSISRSKKTLTNTRRSAKPGKGKLSSAVLLVVISRRGTYSACPLWTQHVLDTNASRSMQDVLLEKQTQESFLSARRVVSSKPTVNAFYADRSRLSPPKA